MIGIYIIKKKDPSRTVYINVIEKFEKDGRQGWKILRTSPKFSLHSLIFKEWMEEKDAEYFFTKRKPLEESEITKMLLTGQISAKFV